MSLRWISCGMRVIYGSSDGLGDGFGRLVAKWVVSGNVFWVKTMSLDGCAVVAHFFKIGRFSNVVNGLCFSELRYSG